METTVTCSAKLVSKTIQLLIHHLVHLSKAMSTTIHSLTIHNHFFTSPFFYSDGDEPELHHQPQCLNGVSLQSPSLIKVKKLK